MQYLRPLLGPISCGQLYYPQIKDDIRKLFINHDIDYELYDFICYDSEVIIMLFML